MSKPWGLIPDYAFPKPGERYVATCLICRKRKPATSKRAMDEWWKAHRAETHHDIGFLAKNHLYRVLDSRGIRTGKCGRKKRLNPKREKAGRRS